MGSGRFAESALPLNRLAKRPPQQLARTATNPLAGSAEAPLVLSTELAGAPEDARADADGPRRAGPAGRVMPRTVDVPAMRAGPDGAPLVGHMGACDTEEAIVRHVEE